ncbi:chlorophyllase-2, chloroplastic-like [Pecten maximus]|uniref:chlorophyllase-2, chloroplastic-like n=1 Tax=Pecten maximus TaxID=6579 RepID=UPI0014581FFF|nr:chlorophyllase-2, chloroplastic-like [Pecten maximus]
MGPHIFLLLCATYLALLYGGQSVFVDQGNPYADGPLRVGELSLAKTIVNSSLHSKVFFPLKPDTYAAVYFIGGLGGLVPTETYEIFLSKVASHGFFVFGVDILFPVYSAHSTPQEASRRKNIGDALEKYYSQLIWLQSYMRNQTLSTIAWDKLALVCHSAGCDDTLRLILGNRTMYSASVFLEPYSKNVKTKMGFQMPALMYGTQLSEEGLPCAIKGFDWNQFYDVWQCPKIKLEASGFGHCDILDPEAWEVCHLTHFCKTTNNTRLSEYRQFVQGAVSSFLMTTLQGRTDALSYISDIRKIPLPVMDLKTEFNCSTIH